jgi:uncharacterized protein with HEPN domain
MILNPAIDPWCQYSILRRTASMSFVTERLPLPVSAPHVNSFMKLEAKKLLFDVITACRDIEQFTAGKTLGDYLDSELLRSAVERKFGIIGEALVRLRAKDRDTFDRIKVSEDAIAFRNRLVHGYDAVDHQTVWETVKNDLPDLKIEAEQLLGNTPES